MSGATYAGASVCPSCKRMVRHKPFGGPHRRHGCRLRWIARRVARSRSQGFDEGYAFALRNISDPMVYADLAEYGTGWAGLIEQGGLTIEADPEPTPAADEHECTFVEEQEPSGRLILPPCLVCGLTAMDALEQLRDRGGGMSEPDYCQACPFLACQGCKYQSDGEKR